VAKFAPLATVLERASGRTVRTIEPTLAELELLEDLVELPSTRQLEEQAGRTVMRLFDMCPDHVERGEHMGDVRHRQIVEQLTRLDQQLQRARRRDQLVEEAGCWCLGLGGRGQIGLMRDANVLVDPNHGFRTFTGGRPVGVGFAEYCDCPAGARARAEHLANADRVYAEQEHERMARLWDSVPIEFRNVSLATYPAHSREQQHTLALIRAWLESTTWLYLYGPVGRGKSSLAVACAAELRQVALYVLVSRMLMRLRATYDGDGREREVLESLFSVPVLILDDLGKERRSDWALEKLFQVIDERWANHKRTVITSNFDIDTLEERFGDAGEAVSSRIRGAARPFLIYVGGPDLRQEKDR
jgi:DNA replication protein DnaC